jgi:hypothetical protein
MTAATMLRLRGFGGLRTGGGALSAGGRIDGGGRVVPDLNHGCCSTVGGVIAVKGLAFPPLAWPGGVKRRVGAVLKLPQSPSAERPTDSGTCSAVGCTNLAAEAAPSVGSCGGNARDAGLLAPLSLMTAVLSAGLRRTLVSRRAADALR